MGGHARVVIFLTADAFGVLPPVSVLTPEQAEYHFLSGFTSKLAGTEAGLGDEPEATFSTCFGAPFLPLHPTVYSKALSARIKQHGSSVFLVNTGWSGGPYGVGERFDLPVTRAIVSAALSGTLSGVATEPDQVFGLHVPTEIEGVPKELLKPRDTWTDGNEYDEKAKQLATRFVDNFEKFASAVDPAVLAAGPRV
jgi:phosphoenolpyruvate carboxykinase (ATP)